LRPARYIINVALCPMLSRPVLLAVVFALTTLATGVLAWRQHVELEALRSRSLDKAERAQLQKRVWDLEKTNRELQSRTPAGTASAPGKSATTAAPNGRENGRATAQQQMAFVRELFARPEVQSYVTGQQKLRLEASYAALFRNLGLNPQQSDRLTSLLLERQNLRGEVADAARAQGLDPRENPEAMRQLIATAKDDLEAAIKTTIGPAGFAALQTYDATLTQRGVVNELQQRLGTGSAPLTAAQAEQMVQILANNPVATPLTSANPAANAPAANPTLRAPDLGPVLAGLLGGGSGPAIAASVFAPMPGGGVTISDQAVVQSQTVLSAPQIAALQQLQQQQQAQQQVQQIVRESLSTANRPAAAAPTAPAPRR
jgi:hypothetical protein